MCQSTVKSKLSMDSGQLNNIFSLHWKVRNQTNLQQIEKRVGRFILKYYSMLCKLTFIPDPSRGTERIYLPCEHAHFFVL